MTRTKPSFISLIATTVVALLVGSGSAAFANHAFPDVPNNHQFHEQIGAMGDAGCYSGFPDGTFRPRDGVNRGQFAFWLHNCSARTSGKPGGALITASDGVVDTTGPVTMTSNALAGTFVTIEAEGRSSATDCNACEYRFQIVDDDTDVALGEFYTESTGAGAAGTFGEDDDSASLTLLGVLRGTVTLRLDVYVDDPQNAGGTAGVTTSLVIGSAPLNGDGVGVNGLPESGPTFESGSGSLTLLTPGGAAPTTR